MNDRRGFLTKFVVAGGALITAGLAGLTAMVISPRASASGRKWRKAVRLTELPTTLPYAAVITDRHDDGWYGTRRQTVVFIDKDSDGGLRALSATCSHLGCHVKWEPTEGQFKCPCHGGRYNRSGKVVSGPPPRALDTVSVRLNATTSDIEVEL